MPVGYVLVYCQAENSNRGSNFSRSQGMRASGTYEAATCSIFGRVARGINREVPIEGQFMRNFGTILKDSEL